MTSKILGIDIETTGLDPKKNAIVQLAGYVEIDYQIVERFNFLCNPINKEISQKALDLCSKTEDEILNYPHPMRARKEFIKILEKYIDKFDKFDKFTVLGYNVKFDLDFLNEWLKEGGENYLYSFISPCVIDPMQTGAVLEYLGLDDYSSLPNRRLNTLCNYYNINLNENAHDAEHDIEATRLLSQAQINLLEKL